MPDRMQADEVFFAALDLRGDERVRYLEKACADDAALRAEVDSLLAADESAGGFLEPEPLEADGADPNLERRIGPWKILRLLGSGGMGRVYLAERADGAFRMQVAIKLVRSGLETSELVYRFEQERQLLAGLEHPNIARLVDGGADDAGHPYLAMEFVAGVPIDRYCDEHGLTVTERLSLFRDVCAAVDFAHRNLVVHRDLKPGNVLVDEGGRVKLLDFGIAKMLQRDSETPDTTRLGSRALTPRYASPEQVRGETVTTATDVYSLGVVLYELLTGARPYDTDRPSPLDVEKAIVDDAPTRPSTAAANTSTSPVAEFEGGARALARRLSGDLDNIVLTAIRKEPARRYGSVEKLSEDVRRHLEGFPVTARADTLGYRTTKFVRRNVALVSAVAALFLVLVGATATSVVLLLRARAAQETAEVERETAEEVSSFLRQMLANADPFQASGSEVTLREIADRAAEQADREWTGRPELAAEVHATLGDVYQHLADHDAAERHLRLALDLYSSADVENQAVVRTHRRLALVHAAREERDSAHVSISQALEIAGRRLDPGNLEFVRCKEQLANLHASAGEHDQAESLAREALAEARAADPPAPQEVASVLNSLSLILVRTGDLGEAESAVREGIEIQLELRGADSYAVAQARQNLGWVLGNADRWEEAEPVQRDVLETYERALDPDHPLVTSARASLAITLQKIGRSGEAADILREVVESDRRRLGADHPRVGTDLANLALVIGDAGQHEEAARTYAEAQEVYVAAFGEEHPWVAITLYSRATMLYRAGQLEEAESVGTRALEMRRRLLREEHPDIARSLKLLGEIEFSQGHAAPAEALFRQCLEIYRANDSTSLSFHTASISVARALIAQARYADAEKLLLPAWDSLQDSRYREEAREALVDLYESWGRRESAATYGEAAASP